MIVITRVLGIYITISFFVFQKLGFSVSILGLLVLNLDGFTNFGTLQVLLVRLALVFAPALAPKVQAVFFGEGLFAKFDVVLFVHNVLRTITKFLGSLFSVFSEILPIVDGIQVTTVIGGLVPNADSTLIVTFILSFAIIATETIAWVPDFIFTLIRLTTIHDASDLVKPILEGVPVQLGSKFSITKLLIIIILLKPAAGATTSTRAARASRTTGATT